MSLILIACHEPLPHRVRWQHCCTAHNIGGWYYTYTIYCMVNLLAGSLYWTHSSVCYLEPNICPTNGTWGHVSTSKNNKGLSSLFAYMIQQNRCALTQLAPEIAPLLQGGVWEVEREDGKSAGSPRPGVSRAETRSVELIRERGVREKSICETDKWAKRRVFDSVRDAAAPGILSQ